MKKFSLLITFTLFLLTIPNSSSNARLTEYWDYNKLMKKADAIIIAKPVETKVIKEEINLPNIFAQDSSGKQLPVKATGIETKFEVLAVLKGGNMKTIILRHYREKRGKVAKNTIIGEWNGPGLVSFDPKKNEEFLMFLRKRKDGKYEAVSGQTDPVDSIKKIGWP